MNKLIQTCLILGVSIPAWADTKVSLSNNPALAKASAESLWTNRPATTRLPRRDTSTALVCSAADAAPKLADRLAEGSCRSHTEDHQVDNRPEAKPWVQRPIDIQSFSGR